MQLPKMASPFNGAQNEFDKLRDHLGAYLKMNAAKPAPRKTPTRRRGHGTHLAARVLGREMTGMLPVPVQSEDEIAARRLGWDELGPYASAIPYKEDIDADLETMPSLRDSGPGGIAPLESRWGKSMHGSIFAR